MRLTIGLLLCSLSLIFGCASHYEPKADSCYRLERYEHLSCVIDRIDEDINKAVYED